MAAVKAKKPTKSSSKTLKASKTKKTNKWLIFGGVTAVAMLGAVIVRFSSASQITTIWYDYPAMVVPGGYPFKGDTVTLNKNGVYRSCVEGYSNNGSKVTLRIGLMISDIGGGNERLRATSDKAYTTRSKHCSKEFKATKSYKGRLDAYNRSNNKLTVIRLSIERVR